MNTVSNTFAVKTPQDTTSSDHIKNKQPNTEDSTTTKRFNLTNFILLLF